MDRVRKAWGQSPRLLDPDIALLWATTADPWIEVRRCPCPVGAFSVRPEVLAEVHRARVMGGRPPWPLATWRPPWMSPVVRAPRIPRPMARTPRDRHPVARVPVRSPGITWSQLLAVYETGLTWADLLARVREAVAGD